MMLYVESQLLLDDTEWFSSDITADNTVQNAIDIFLGYYIPYFSLIILNDRKRLIDVYWCWFFFFNMPIP